MTFIGGSRDGIRKGLLATFVVLGALAGAAPAQAAISVSSPSVTEGNSGQADLAFTITDSQLICGGDVTVSTVPGTAASGTDFVPLSNASVPIPGGFLSCNTTVNVKVNGDLIDEPNETLELRVSTGGTGTGTINDDDPPPSVSIGAGARAEGTGGSGYVGLPVALSSPSSFAITVPYTVEAGSASIPQDISGAAGSIIIPAGANGGEIRVVTVADDVDELDETFTVTIGTPTNATRGTEAATGTVLNDDVPVVSIGGVTSAEGTGASSTPFSFPITLSNSSTRAISVRVVSADVQAVAPADYAAVDRIVTFEPGDTGQVVTVDVVADALHEGGEAFAMSLSEPSGATLGTASVLGAILDDDAAAGVPPTVPGGSVVARPVGGTPTTPATPASSDRTAPKVRLTSLVVRRPSSIRVKIACPATETRCTGSVTVFSVAQTRSKIRSLRRETRLARGTFTLAGGKSTTLTMKTSATGLKLLRAVKRLKVRGYGVSRDAAGNVGTGTLNATLRR